jgi:hypothetical protein
MRHPIVVVGIAGLALVTGSHAAAQTQNVEHGAEKETTIQYERIETRTTTVEGEPGQEVTIVREEIEEEDVQRVAGEDVALPPPTSPDVPERERGAPADAFEIGVQGGYTQPFGDVQRNRSFRDFANAGGAVALDLGWRFTPYVSLGLLSQYHEQVVDRNVVGEADLRGFAGTIQGTFHFMPYGVLDPYLTLGTGYRVLWESFPGADNDVLTHGFQLARAMLGVDFRVSDSLALGPVAGADLNLFLWENPEGGTTRSRALDDPRPSTFVFAGLAARFDVGGRRVSDEPPRYTAGR